MQKSFIVFLSMLLVVWTFSSCNQITDNETTGLSSESLIETYSLWLPNDSLAGTGDEPCIERYAFKTLEDFKLFCETGSRDLTLYKIPPKHNAFPPYNMLKGCFVEITELFPAIDKNSVTIDHIEIENSGKYIYSGYTNAEETPFSISIKIKYENPSPDISVDKVVDALNTSAYDQVICADYCATANRGPSTKGSILYVCELSKCIVTYYVYNEKIQGMSIHSGGYVIGLSPSYSDNVAFFTDEVLKPLSCLFEDGDGRVEALNGVAAFTASKQ